MPDSRRSRTTPPRVASSRFRRGALVLVAVAAASLPGRARAHCGDDCAAPLPMFVTPATDRLATDGVLAFPFELGRAAEGQAFFTIEVRDAAGVAVPGALELREEFSTLVWRPASPWTPGATYEVVTRIDTAAWASAVYGALPGACVTADVETEIAITDAPLPAPAAPPLLVTTRHTVEPPGTLASLVCCDGALPYLMDNAGHCPGADGTRIEYEPGTCTHREQRGRLAVVYHIDWDAVPAAMAGNLATRLLGPGSQQRVGSKAVLSAPGCLRHEVLDLARGQVFVDERCFGDELAEQLGTLADDPSPELAACAGPAYVCEGKTRWDPERCVTWPEGQVFEVADEPAPPAADPPLEAGCGCRARPTGPAGLALLAGLLGLRRRPRGRPARAQSTHLRTN